jgi:putative Holliday junction resolvase
VTEIPRRGRVIGVDLGAKRVGVAVCDGDQRLATASRTLVRQGDREAERRSLLALVDEYEAVGVVVGLPRSLSGQLGPAAAGALEEVEAIRTLAAVPVETVDERLTTVSAASSLHAAGGRARQHRRVIDQVAAAVLLQSWLDRRAGDDVDADQHRAEGATPGMDQPRT